MTDLHQRLTGRSNYQPDPTPTPAQSDETRLDAEIDKMLMWNIQGHTEPGIFQPEMKKAIKKVIAAERQRIFDAVEAEIGPDEEIEYNGNPSGRDVDYWEVQEARNHFRAELRAEIKRLREGL